MDIKGQEVEKEGVSNSMEMYEESVLDERSMNKKYGEQEDKRKES